MMMKRTIHLFRHSAKPQARSDLQERSWHDVWQERSWHDVWQDNNAPRRVRVGSAQPSPVDTTARKRLLSAKSARAHKHSTKRRTVMAAGWVTRPISSEIDRLAKDAGLTRSRTIATLL